MEKHKMKCLSIIFDLDGTLLDTLQDIAETGNAVLAQHGFPIHPHEEYKHFVGDGLSILMQRITPPGTKTQLIERCCQLFLLLYSDNWSNNCRPYKGVEGMLAAIKEKGVNMSVLSNKPHAFTKLFVDRFFSGMSFSFVLGQREGFAKKPDPTIALDIAKKMKTYPSEMFFVGDTATDIQTGKASGMMTVGVTWGFRSANELHAENPDILINNPMELLQYV